jgi:G3E family GTPase
VVRLAPWLEPEPICIAITHVSVHGAPGYPDAPAGHDVQISAVVTCLDGRRWLTQALSREELRVGRRLAQVVIEQAEFADVIVLSDPEPLTRVVLARLTPRAVYTGDGEGVEGAVGVLDRRARRGRRDHPQGPLLVGQPPLQAEGEVQLLTFEARRPFHPQRLHLALSVLVTGVVRTRGRIWLANHPQECLLVQSAGGALQLGSGGKWMAVMTPAEVRAEPLQRRADAELRWDEGFGDRHTSSPCWSAGPNPTTSCTSCTPRCSPMRRWLDPPTGPTTPTPTPPPTQALDKNVPDTPRRPRRRTPLLAAERGGHRR